MIRFQVLLSIVTLHLYKTDFVQKVISQLNVGQSMIELERVQTDAIRVTASHAQCDGRSCRQWQEARRGHQDIGD